LIDVAIPSDRNVIQKESERKLKYKNFALGGLVVACLPPDPRFAGSNPAEDNGFLRVIKIRSTTSFGGEVKSSVPCRRFTACKRTLRIWKRCFVQNSAAMFLTHVSPALLLDGSSSFRL
jgi:hypothetical protein